LAWIFYKIAFSNTVNPPTEDAVVIPAQNSRDQAEEPKAIDVDYDDQIIIPDVE